jgi:hypothetical protein
MATAFADNEHEDVCPDRRRSCQDGGEISSKPPWSDDQRAVVRYGVRVTGTDIEVEV